MSKRMTKTVDMPIVLKGPRTMFGEDDVIHRKRRGLTCVCDSLSADVVVIRANDFLKRLNVMDTWSQINELNGYESRWQKKRIKKLTTLGGKQKSSPGANETMPLSLNGKERGGKAAGKNRSSTVLDYSVELTPSELIQLRYLKKRVNC
jgi:hypothetical protein